MREFFNKYKSVYILIVFISICIIGINVPTFLVNADEKDTFDKHSEKFSFLQMMLPGSTQLSALSSIDTPPIGPAGSDKIRYSKDKIIVKFKEGAGSSTVNGIMSLYGMQIEKSFKITKAKAVRLPKGKSVEEAVEALRKVEYAEPNYIYSLDFVPNDTRFNELWGLNNTGQTSSIADADIDAPEAWDIHTADSGPDGEVVVAVVDTGIDFFHQDIADNMWVNPFEIPGNGIDDDSNGYVDDIHGIYIDTIQSLNDYPGHPYDDHPLGHGTHVSGTIAAKGNDSTGVAGVAWGGNVKLMALKIFDYEGDSNTDTILGCLEYIMAMSDAGVNIRVANNSWGGGAYSQAIYDAIQGMRDRDILFVASAGNYNYDNDFYLHYPSSYDLDNIIAVAATDHDDKRSQFSNYGRTSVDIAAPGEDILSTVPFFEDNYVPTPRAYFFDDMESGETGWEHGALWELSELDSSSPTTSWWNNRSLDTCTGVTGPCVLVSPAIDLSNVTDTHIAISFKAYLDMHVDIGPNESLMIEFSNNGYIWERIVTMKGRRRYWKYYFFISLKSLGHLISGSGSGIFS